MTTIFIVDFFESPIDQHWIDGNRRLHWSSMINNDHCFPLSFSFPLQQTISRQNDRGSGWFFSTAGWLSVIIDQWWSNIIFDDLKLTIMMIIYQCLFSVAWLLFAYDWSTLFYLSSNPWMSAVAVSQLISMSTSLFTTLHTLGNFFDQKLYLYQLISPRVKYYQDWIFSVIIINVIINIHENDRVQWSLYLYIIVFMNNIVTLRSYSHINSSSYSHVPAFPDNWHLRRIDNQRALRRMVKVIIFSLLLNSDPWKSSYPATLLGLNIMDVTKFLAGKFCSS